MDVATLTSHESILNAFEGFRSELDAENDRRERIVKSSRDITIHSKRAIFLLHRLANSDNEADRLHEHTGGSEEQRKPKDFLEARTKLGEIQTILRSLRPELAGELFWRHQSAISPGLQEYIEALSFLHYLETGKMIGFGEVQDTLRDEQGSLAYPLGLDDYLLGVSDLTGELMRFAISAIGRRGGRTKAREVSDFVRECKADFDGFVPFVKQLSKKQAVTSQSLVKIEEAAYAIAVRASEYGEADGLLEEIVARTVFRVKNKDDSGCEDII